MIELPLINSSSAQSERRLGSRHQNGNVIWGDKEDNRVRKIARVSLFVAEIHRVTQMNIFQLSEEAVAVSDNANHTTLVDGAGACDVSNRAI